jgi:NADPH:quinone reductase-like Zn-dependent oxidoreductase
MTSGQYQHPPKPPYTPGLEYAGVVAWRGPAASGIEVGDSVLVDAFIAGPRSYGDYQQWGGFASYGVAPIEAIHPLPGALTFDQACNLLGNYETAYHCLITRGRIQRGETVLIHGASGSTGLAAVQVAKHVGATVIATGRSDAKLAVVKAQGADHVINTSDLSVLRDAVKSLTGGEGVDVVYDGVGGDISVESLRCMKFGGRFVIVGWAATLREPGRTKRRVLHDRDDRGRAEREPAADEHHPDEGARDSRRARDHLGREEPGASSAPARAGPRVGCGWHDFAACLAYVPAIRVQGRDVREVARRRDRWMRAASRVSQPPTGRNVNG